MDFLQRWRERTKRQQKEPPPSQTFVIGAEIAQARRAEEARLANPDLGPSPLPANLHYESWRGDLDLVDPPRHPLDDELKAICDRYAAGDEAERTRLRDAASLEDFYTLLGFSKRSAVFAMRDGKVEHVAAGLNAIAMIEQAHIDFRDPLHALSLLHHAGRRIGANVDDLMGTAMARAEPKMAELILGFLQRSEDQRDIRKSWGYTVIETPAGLGFIHCGFDVYQPSYPLDQFGLALAKLLKQDKYEPVTVRIATSFPDAWLTSVDDAALERARRSIRAAVTVHADLRPHESPDYAHQRLILFLVELDHERASQSLMRLSRERQERPRDFSIVAACEGRLFCLAVARAFLHGKPSFETQETIQRFSAGIGAVMKNQYRK